MDRQRLVRIAVITAALAIPAAALAAASVGGGGEGGGCFMSWCASFLSCGG